MRLLLLTLLTLYTSLSFAQDCTMCDVFASDATNPFPTTSDGQTVCVNGSFSGSLNSNNLTVCIESGVTMTAQFSLPNSATINVYGTLNDNTFGGASGSTIINVKAGGQYNTTNNQGITGTVDIETGGNWVSAGNTTVNSGGVVNVDGTATFNGGGINALEINEGEMNITGTVNITGELYVHGDFHILTNGVVNTGDFRMTSKVNGDAVIDGELNVSEDVTLDQQGPLGTGYINIDGDFSANVTNAGKVILGESLKVVVGGSSSINDCNSSLISPDVVFCDLTSPDNDFDSGNGCSDGTSSTYTVDCQILPIDLTYFVVKEATNGSFLLEWRVGSASNFQGFELLEDYGTGINRLVAKIGYVKGQQVYRSEIIKASEYNRYYKLKMIDLSGGYYYSNIRAVSGKIASISLFPNPASSEFVTVTNSSTDKMMVCIRDVHGKELSRGVLEGAKEYNLALPHATGIYFLEVLSGRNTKTIKVVKE